MSMVAFSIASLAIFQLMIFGMRSFQRSDARNSTQRELLKVSQRLVRELAPCPNEGVTVLYPSGLPALADLAFSFCTPRNEDGSVGLDNITQGPIYANQVLYYRNPASNEIMRFSKALTSTVPVAELSSEMRLTINAAKGQSQMHNCTGFQLLSGMSGVPDSQTRNPWVFCLQGRSQKGQLLELRFLAYAN
ncbi:hypothetical protein JST97_35770 [bacterium]|nr:hypothetical protein [bacterium]